MSKASALNLVRVTVSDRTTSPSVACFVVYSAISVTLSEEIESGGQGMDRVDVLALDEALERLAVFDERKAKIIELHHFGGLSYDEVADVLDISAATVHRELRMARAWLFKELSPG